MITTDNDRKEALEAAAKFYAWLVLQPRQGVHTPLPRQLKQIVKMAFAKDGITTIAEVERIILSSKKITPSIVGQSPMASQKKAIEARRAQRVSTTIDSAVEQSNNNRATAMQERQRRVHMRGLLQTTSLTELEENESVAEVEVAEAPTTQAPQATQPAKPLTATEVAVIPGMGAKEILQQFGEERILLTLQKMYPSFERKGSAAQLANRLKSKLTPAK